MICGFVIGIWGVFGFLGFGMECSPTEILIRHFVCFLGSGPLPF
jgi:hypothetical protein